MSKTIIYYLTHSIKTGWVENFTVTVWCTLISMLHSPYSALKCIAKLLSWDFVKRLTLWHETLLRPVSIFLKLYGSSQNVWTLPKSVLCHAHHIMYCGKVITSCLLNPTSNWFSRMLKHLPHISDHFSSFQNDRSRNLVKKYVSNVKTFSKLSVAVIEQVRKFIFGKASFSK